MHKIRLIPVLLFTICLVITATILMAQTRARLVVTVIDKKTGNPVQNAEVGLNGVASNGLDFSREIKYSDKHGRVKFNVSRKNDSYNYSVSAKKDDFYPYYNPETLILESYRQNIQVDWGNKNFIELYLFSDAQNSIDYSSKVYPRIPIATFIMFLKSNKYKDLLRNYNTARPQLLWEDIPELLEIANSTKIITQMPINPISSTILDNCMLGVVTLWMIESIRICEGQLLVFCKKYPSLIPVLKSDHDNPEETLKKAHEAYRSWWENSGTTDISKLSSIDPLKGTGISWK